MLQKEFLTFLTGAKERLIDMVFEFKAQNVLEKNPKEQDLIKTSLELNNLFTKENFFVEDSHQHKLNEGNNLNKDSIFCPIENRINFINNDDMQIETEDKPNLSNSTDFISQRNNFELGFKSCAFL